MDWATLNYAGLVFCFLVPGIIIGLAFAGVLDGIKKRKSRRK